jgi:RNA-directed DNA polymerase
MVERREDTPSVPSSGEAVETKLRRIARKARSDPKFQFTSLFHLMNEELLRGCFKRLRGRAAAGIDGVTKDAYAEHLEENLTALVERLHRLAYVPQSVRRVYIPKPGSVKGRPLGITCLEDKLVESGLVRILEQIYEQDFIDDSFGFRPDRGCHDALRALNVSLERGGTEWVVEADIKGFFDNVDHDWLMRFLAHRVADRRVLRMVKRFLKAGVCEDGQVYVSDEGVPQGGNISPILANVYLHYALDLWFEGRFRKGCTGRARLIRYADDFVVCFSKQTDAERFRSELVVRLAEFGLEVEPSKTKVLAFGRSAQGRARRQGRSKPETFDFLGFTHFCGRTRDGKRFHVKRVTAKKKFKAKLAAIKAWLKLNRARLRTRALWEQICVKIRGHFAYYGVTGNFWSLDRFLAEVKQLLFQWLNRRGGRRHMTWEQFTRMQRSFPFPRLHTRVNLYHFA